MRPVALVAWVAGCLVATVAVPWIAFGLASVYFKLLRRGTDDLAWFDLPAMGVALVSSVLINIGTPSPVLCSSGHRS